MAKDRLTEMKEEREKAKLSSEKCKSKEISFDPEFLDKASTLVQAIDDIKQYIDEASKIQKDVFAYHHQQNSEFDEEATDHSPLLSGAQDRMKSSQHASITRQLMEVMGLYNKLQLDYRDKCKSRIQDQLRVAGVNLSENDIENMLERKNPEIFTHSIMTCTESAKRSLCEVEARHADFLRLEKHIEELRDLFIAVSTTVNEQSELIDRVEYNVNRAVESTQKAKSDLTSAVGKQKKTRRYKMICYIVLIVLTLMFIIAIGSMIGLL